MIVFACGRVDSTTERMRRASLAGVEEIPSLGGTYIQGEPIPTQEDFLNVSAEVQRITGAHKPHTTHIRRLFSETNSPEKGRVLTPDSLASGHQELSTPDRVDTRHG